MGKKFLDRVYGLLAPDQTQALYDAWADTYEDEIAENGYATPGRVAKAMADHISDKSTPLLDFGCGTGLSGVALQQAGFTAIDGMDPSNEMLTQANAKRCYRNLTRIDPADPAPIPEGTYAAITAIGVIGPGAAPASTFHVVLKGLSRGGRLGVSLNDHALSQKVYEAAMCQWLDCGAARLIFKKYGDHLPGQNIKSNVYIIEKS